MTSASTASSIRNAAHDTANQAREGVREVGKAAADASGTIESDMQALRDDFRRLADQVADILAKRGDAAWARAKSGLDDALSDATDKGRDAAEAVREVSDSFVAAIDEFLETRPYATLAIAAGLGFLFGVIWRR